MSHDTPTAAEKLLDQILDGKITDPQEIEAIRERLKASSQNTAVIPKHIADVATQTFQRPPLSPELLERFKRFDVDTRPLTFDEIDNPDYKPSNKVIAEISKWVHRYDDNVPRHLTFTEINDSDSAPSANIKSLGQRFHGQLGIERPRIQLSIDRGDLLPRYPITSSADLSDQLSRALEEIKQSLENAKKGETITLQGNPFADAKLDRERTAIQIHARPDFDQSERTYFILNEADLLHNVLRDDIDPSTIRKLSNAVSYVSEPDNGIYSIYLSDHNGDPSTAAERAEKILDQVFVKHESHQTDTNPAQLVLKVNDADFATLQELGVNITKPKPKSIYDMGF